MTLHRVLVHVIAETCQHAGHADIVRELIDGKAGLAADRPNLPSADPAWWQATYDRVERAAREAARPRNRLRLGLPDLILPARGGFMFWPW